jgi:ABC-type transport system involved in multi-copper enzyme maturation permease subunit
VIEAARVHARIAWLSMRRRKLIWICAALAFLPAVASAILLAEGNGGRDLYDNLMELYFYFMVPFVPTLLLASAVGDEVDGKTYTFWFARPAPRAAMLLGRWAAATAAAAAIMAIALLLSWALSMIRLSSDFVPELIHFLRTELGALLGVAAFGALAIAIGTFFVKHPLIAAIVYLLVIEATIGSTPLVINAVALSWHLRNLADLGQPSNFGPTAHIPVLISAAILVIAPPGLLALAGFRLKDAEY